MNDKLSIILITGSPGVGKTTLVKNICKDLPHCYGFFTEEVRNSAHNRIGFDAVSVRDGERGILARETAVKCNRPSVGKYCVFVNEFERFTLPLLQPTHGKGLLVIDEIGKMELKSRKFEAAVQNVLDTKTLLLATIPSQTRQPIAIVERMKSLSYSKLFHLTKENRVAMLNEVLTHVRQLVA